ncbi:hypothetical protein Tco_0993175 [Tanacetum coccineum]|uniref:Uncharacterized protein n=1 Tax=Tanacetum coccineum TaxID=301880 RepID=A0ABQ5F462_9ASTR
MVAIDGAGFNWSYMEDDEVPTNMALMAFSDSEGRKIAKIDQDPGISLVQHDAKIKGRYGHDMQFDFDATKEVTIASVVVSTVSPTRNTGVSTAGDITMAGTMVYIRKSSVKDKGKGKMAESETVQTKTKLQQEQERLDFEAAMRLKAELEEEERQRIVKRLQAEEREKYTEAEQARMLTELIKQRKRFTLKALGSTRRSSELEIILSLVKEKFNRTEITDDKEREVWVELKRLFEPDTNDELWKLQKKIQVHHVYTEEGIDIYMLVEKEYPLSRGTLTLISYKIRNIIIRLEL